MNNPYQEIFDTILMLSKQQGYPTFDYLPDDGQGYPFVFIGAQQNIDQYTKDRTLGQTHLQIDIYGDAHQKQRSLVMGIIDTLTQVITEHQKTPHFGYQVTHSESRLIGDISTDIPLWHGVLELDIQYH